MDLGGPQAVKVSSPEILFLRRTVNRKLTGHYAYFYVSDNWGRTLQE